MFNAQMKRKEFNMTNHTITVTGRKTFITKSRSGHHTLTVRELGTWQLDGKTYPLNRVVASISKLELAQARALATQYKGA
jgi:hypothetical protein